MKKAAKQKEEPDFGNHYGDLGVIAIALLFTLAFIVMIFAPSPFKGLGKSATVIAERAQAIQIEAAQKKKQHDDAVASGMVTVGIAPDKH